MNDLGKINVKGDTVKVGNNNTLIVRLFSVGVMLITISAGGFFTLNIYENNQKTFSSIDDSVIEMNDKIERIENVLTLLANSYDKNINESYNKSENIIKKINEIETENEMLKNDNDNNLDILDKKISNMLKKIDKIQLEKLENEKNQSEPVIITSKDKYLFPHDPDSVSLIDLLHLPSNLTRVSVAKGSFNDWLRHVPTKKINNGIFNYLKKLMFPPNFAYAIVDIETKKYQECADIAMRMWSEYLFSTNKLYKLNFNFDNGQKNTMQASDRGSLDKYLFKQFSYASSLSLKRDLKDVSVDDVLPGDVIVQRNGSSKTGHVFVIMDVAQDSDGNKKVVLGQSNIPAQSFHVVSNPMKNLGWHNYRDEFSKKPMYARINSAILSLASLNSAKDFAKNYEKSYSYWYDLKTLLKYTQEVPNGKGVLRRFR